MEVTKEGIAKELLTFAEEAKDELESLVFEINLALCSGVHVERVKKALQSFDGIETFEELDRVKAIKRRLIRARQYSVALNDALK